MDANANEKSFSLKCVCANSWPMQLLVRRRDKQNKTKQTRRIDDFFFNHRNRNKNRGRFGVQFVTSCELKVGSTSPKHTNTKKLDVGED